ncbi:MAG: MFS transporter [Coriobacteriia bacterium]|nr:MFS transporter [Coriobacteriia bacterium]
MEAPLYKRNLIVLWLGNFVAGVGLSLVQPFMPLFIDSLGEFTVQELAFWSGLMTSAPFLSQAIVSPLWGKLADRSGRKLMYLRSSLGSAIIMIATAFVPNVQTLLIVRLLYGCFSGHIANAVALIAAQVPKEDSGKVMGILSTSNTSGMLIGPLIGGVAVTFIGYSRCFMITGVVLTITFFLALFLVKEEFTPVEKGKQLTVRQVYASLDNPKIIIGMYITTLILMVTISSINPILTLYVRQVLGRTTNVEIWSGLMASGPALVSIFAAPLLGGLGDKIGTHKVLMFGLILSSVVFIPMAFVTAVWQLLALRMILGMTDGSMRPSIQTMLTRYTPSGSVSRVFSYNQSFQSVGMMIGPMVGSTIGGAFGFNYVFYATTVFALINLLNVLRITRGQNKET